jgi:hypothetical protein
LKETSPLALAFGLFGFVFLNNRVLGNVRVSCAGNVYHFFFLFICVYNVWVISPPFPNNLPYHSTPSLTLPTPSIPGRNYIALISNFVEAHGV